MPLRVTFEPAAGAAPSVAGPQRGVVRDQRGPGGGRVAQDGAQQSAGGAGGPRGDPGPGGQGVLPSGDPLSAERVQFAGAPRGADEPADQVLAVVLRADADVLDGQPPVDPFADRGLARVRVGPAAL